jgi:hypothetical protein
MLLDFNRTLVRSMYVAEPGHGCQGWASGGRIREQVRPNVDLMEP